MLANQHSPLESAASRDASATVCRDVTVVIAAWRADGTIGRAVASALAQPEAAEVVVVDDASGDDGATLAAARAADDGTGRLIVLALEKVFDISASRKLFNWFFGLYNAGVVLTAGMLMVHGSLTVLGEESNKMIAGIAGLGHMLITAGMIVFFLALRRAVLRHSEAREPAPVH